MVNSIAVEAGANRDVLRLLKRALADNSQDLVEDFQLTTVTQALANPSMSPSIYQTFATKTHGKPGKPGTDETFP
jgi:hypothetical protein